MKKSAGFTLLEILLSIAAIVIIGGISIPIYQSFQTRNDLDIAAVTIAQGLRRAQILAQASAGDTSSGVFIQSGSITIFRGVNFVARDPAFDEIFEMPASLTASGISEIIFSKFTGLPEATGTITITSNANESRVITINSKGAVDY